MKHSRTIVLLPGDLEVAIGSLRPGDLKERLKKARESASTRSAGPNALPGISHSLNHLVAALGFAPDFRRYRSEGYPRLEAFMAEHALRRPADLITPRRERKAGMEGYYLGRLSLDRQDVSERVFLSGLPCPDTLFTGYDFDYWRFWDDGYRLLERGTWPNREPRFAVAFRSPVSTAPEDVEANVALARLHGDEEIDTGHPDHPRRRVVDLVLGGYLPILHDYFHLFGDLRTDRADRSGGRTVDHDFDRSDLGPHFHDYARPVVELFRERIEAQRHGWVDVLQFNERLTFLRGTDGEYDALVRNQRGSVFDTRVYGRRLAARDVPRALPDYRFERWFHFEHAGWRSRELRAGRRADLADPAVDGIGASDREVRLRHYTRTGQFRFEPVRADAPLPGFRSVDTESGRLAVSNPVSVDDLLAWASRPDSVRLPDGDDLLGPVNGAADRSLPAAVTLHAALRYARAEEDRLGVPLRLMTESEYRALRRTEVGERSEASAEPLLEFVDPAGNVFDGHPPYMPEADFQRWHLRYRRSSLDWIELADGLRAVDSDEIAEWLHEGTCILSASLVDPDSRGAAPLRRAAPESTGKYKGHKRVFRLCHELARRN